MPGDLTETKRFANGAAYRRDAGIEHNVINAGKEPMPLIEIEYKGL
jgi:mannose-6-phosphate isomerase-like protein (cupin superfamily)